MLGGYQYSGAGELESTDTVEQLDSRGYWTTTSWRMPYSANEACAAFLEPAWLFGNVVAVLGGNPMWRQANLLDLDSGYWTRLPDPPTNLGSCGCTAGWYRDRPGVFVAGGFQAEQTALFLDPVLGEWERLADLPAGGTQLAAALLAGPYSPVVLGGGANGLGGSVLRWTGEDWQEMAAQLVDPNTAGAAAVSVSKEWASWVEELDEIDWSVDNVCSEDGGGEGELSLASIYSDHMVLQRAPARPLLWGRGTPGSQVSLVVADSAGEQVGAGQGRVEEDGVWEARLEAGVEAGAGFTITVTLTLPGGGNTAITLQDVAFGEVWLCSGQSNMELRVRNARTRRRQRSSSDGSGPLSAPGGRGLA